MRLALALPLACALALGCSKKAAAPPPPPARVISRAALENKMRGGWAGQMIGVSYGTPTEFRSLAHRIDDGTAIGWSPKNINFAIHQDDLYVDMCFAAVMDRLGLDATTEQYGEAFGRSKFRLWHANAAARKNLNRGIKAPDSGLPENNIHANDIDFQIECDFIGLMCPGLPREVCRYCERVGRVMNYGDGLYGGMYIGGMYAAAYFEDDPRRIVEAGLACLPKESHYADVVRDVLAWSAQYPDDWRKTWQAMEEKWDKNDSCVDGALSPFNIDAAFNGGYVAIGLLYGGGDFGRTVEIATRCGQDSDCNPSNAGGVIGTALGYEKIPEEWKGGIPEIAHEKFEYTDYSFEEICESTMKRAQEAIKRAGGSVEGDTIHIPGQAPEPPPLEQWTMGIPKKLIPPDDPSFVYGDPATWVKIPDPAQTKIVKGEAAWVKFTDPARGKVMAFGSETPGAEMELRFTGEAVALVGPLSQKGGRADLYLDGQKRATIDAYIVPLTSDSDLWHIRGLKLGEHTLRLVLREDADSRSEGRRMIIAGAITYTSR